MSEQPTPGSPMPANPGEPPQPAPSRARPVVLIVALVALVALGVGYSILRMRQREAPPSAPTPVVAQPQVADAGPAVGTVGPPPPTVQEGDTRVRELVGPLSTDPELAKWLGVEGLLQRFTTAVSNIADGESPRMVLSFMAPMGPFLVAENEGKTTIDPASYERYDAVARVIGSLDLQGAARAWLELKPLIERVYAEIAPPGRTFERTFNQAIQHLLEVPVPQGEVEVVPKGGLYAYADTTLESLSQAQKHLLRMGPKNIQTIQRRLQELHTAMNLPPIER